MTVQYHPSALGLRSAGKTAAIGAWECRLPTQELCWTDGVYDLFGLRRGDIVRRADILDLYEESSRREMDRLRSQSLASGQPFSLDCRIRTESGAPRWMRLVAGVDRHAGRNARIFGSKQDITAEKGAWRALASQAEPRTLISDIGLKRFDDALREFQTRAAGFGCALAVYALDDEAQIRAAFGAGACDAAVKTIGERLRRLFPDALAIAPLAQGSFALLLAVPPQSARLAGTLESARQLVKRPMTHGAFVIDLPISAGVATATASAAMLSRLVAGAEAGLKAARLQGGNRLRQFDGPLLAAAAPAR